MDDSIKICLGKIYIVNLGSRKLPKYRAFILLSDSFLISKHEFTMTEREMFETPRWTSKQYEKGMENFRKAFFFPLFDSSDNWDDFNRRFMASKGDDADEVMISLDKSKFIQVRFLDISEIKYRFNFFLEERKITMTISNNPFFKRISFVVCIITGWGVRDQFSRGTKEIYLKIKQALSKG